jgi:hypothetical protein
MTKISQQKGDGKNLKVRTSEVERFFDVWSGEPEPVRAFIRDLARKLDEVESVVAENSCFERGASI